MGRASPSVSQSQELDVNISETCIRRPVMTTLVTASLIVFGFFAYRLLSVAALPAGAVPDRGISVEPPGAGAGSLVAPGAAPTERGPYAITGLAVKAALSAIP